MTRSVLSSILWVAVAMFCLTDRAFGQSQIFVKVGDIVGPSLDARHRGESEVFSVSWGNYRIISQQAGGSRTAAPANFSTLSISKLMDQATPALLGACATGKPMARSVITMRSGNSQVVEFCRIVLEDVVVTSVNESAGSDGAPFETVELSFSRFGAQYISIVASAPGPVSAFGWDLMTATSADLAFPPVLSAYDKDSDGDGMPDWWEAAYGLDPLTPDGDGDLDADGATNLEEFLAGTNPHDATQVFRAQLDFSAGDRMATLTWPSVEGRQYNLMTTDALGTAFQNLMTVPSGGSSTTIPITMDLAKKFFRVQAVPAP